ncbi:lanthionine synthetase LanC family protein [Streptomyces sp. NPDC058049]|uniref:lanthionine synthetase LanC family protein n=1 Tax=Streptomyces sp. NPDC058049 TaxID=3346314 RepID=UPI0036EC6F39
MSTYRDQLDQLTRCVRVMKGPAFSWFGRRVSATTAEPGADTAADQLQSLLARYLYKFYYVTGAPVPTGVRLAQVGSQLDGELVDAIGVGAAGTSPWEGGWRVAGRHPDGIVVEREGIAFLVPPCDTDPNRQELAGSLAVRQPSFLRAAQPGFCFVLGDTTFPAPHSGRTRFYWNLFPDGAPALARALTGELNDCAVPFSLKLVNSEDGYTRCDAAVLLVPDEHLPTTLEVVARRSTDMAWALKDGVPALAKRLAPGIAAAEDPGTGESFGQHCCRLLAEALCAPEVLAARGAQRRTNALAHVLERNGLSVTEPYLRVGSADRLVLPQPQNSQHHRRATDNHDAAPALVPAAARIGELLLDEALWSDDACTWLVPRAGTPEGSAVGSRRSWSSAGADVYGGAAGIAYFLADLAAVLDDVRFARAATGALRYAAHEVDRSMRPQDATFHLGWTGVVYCLLRAGDRLRRPDLISWGERIARERLGKDTICGTNDWLGGLAGNITGLLALAREGLAGPLVETADRLGRTLLARATGTDGVRTWPPDVRRHRTAPLTGMAHGAAGIALALTELAVATGNPVYSTAAFEAVAYERRCFSRTQLNWPDLRRDSARDGTRGGRRYAVAWCHGAPGIALARASMWLWTGDDELRAEAELGLETTWRSLDWLIGDRMERMVLCHGLSGNLAVVRQCERQGLVAGQEYQASTTAVARHLQTVASLTSGDGSTSRWARENPSLLTGVAGIGQVLLQEAGASTSCLLVAPTAGPPPSELGDKTQRAVPSKAEV